MLGSPFRLEKVEEIVSLVIRNGDCHSTCTDHVTELALAVTYFLGKEFFKIWLACMELRFVFTQNPMYASNTTMHGPFHVCIPMATA